MSSPERRVARPRLLSAVRRRRRSARRSSRRIFLTTPIQIWIKTRREKTVHPVQRSIVSIRRTITRH